MAHIFKYNQQSGVALGATMTLDGQEIHPLSADLHLVAGEVPMLTLVFMPEEFVFEGVLSPKKDKSA